MTSRIRNKLYLLIAALGTLLWASCTQEYSPRGKGYPYLEVPAVHHYQRYRDAACPFSFEYSTLARIEDYNLLKLRNEAHRLTYEHAKRADYIEPQLITAPNQIYALVYNVGGAAASPTQFFVTDTVNHWLRGALYFKTSPNPDSLEPLINYIDEDIGRLIRSIRWE